jgi:hypothetical protein
MSPTLTGLVYEDTPEGRRPIAGAVLEAYTLSILRGDNPATASTISGSTGRYLLCRLPTTVAMFASNPGYDVVSTSVHVNGDGVLDIELKRK